MADAVFILCAVTSVACAALLLRGYVKSRSRLLLWSGLCFLGFTVNNVLVLVDLWLVPSIDLSLWRSGSALAGISVLLFGLVWDAH